MVGSMRQSTCMVLVLLVAALGMTACAGSATVQKTEEAAPTVQEPSTYEHTVRWPGEKLSIIAKWYTGDSKNWMALARENPSLSPNKLKIGTIIQIPRNIMTNTEPMPRSAIIKASKSKRPPGAKGVAPRKGAPQVEPSGEAESAETQGAPAQQPEKEKKENLDLFGPKE
jgi:hypothetical protein